MYSSFFHLTTMSFTQSLLVLEQVSFAYSQQTLWAHWSHRWSAGLGLVCGDEGAGKSTLLRLLAGQLVPQQGRVLLSGVDSSSAPERYQAQVFWIDPRHPLVDEKLTPEQWGAHLAQRYPGWQQSQWLAHIDGWSLQEHWRKPFFALSTGSQRKVFMAAALACGAPLVLIDEPESGLDKPSIRYLQQALTQAAARAQQQGQVLLVAHYAALPDVSWDSRLELPVQG